jgi:predicted dehydrogenase
VLRVVVAGCGRMSKRFLEAAREAGGVEIVGLVDPVLTAAEGRRDEFALDGAAVGPDLAEMLRRVSPDAVFDIVVPPARHGVATTALRHGCHTLTEKPMADSMAHARDLIATARAAGRIHAVVQNRRYIAGVRRIARLLRSGVLGDVTSIYCDFFLGPHFGGFREEMEHVLLVDMAIHTFDVSRLFAGAEAASVHCREWNPGNSWYAHGASAIATFEMRNGVVVSYRGSWCAEGLRTSWESSWRIIGSRGTLLWDGEDDMRAEIVTGPGFFSETEPVEIPPLDPGDRIGGHTGIIRDFVEAVRTGVPPETAGFENIKSLAMVFAAVESAESGRTVSLQEGVPPT